MFRKVLIANRGEIAVRIIRALREKGIASVAVFSDADRHSLHVRLADEAEHIGPSSSGESYLRIDRILEAAKVHGADAIHPGYGFLSEDAEFAGACESGGITFIGPSIASIGKLGSKIQARRLARQAGVPVVPGTEEPTANLDQARTVARELGYPVLLKAAAGGGGKGMRRVNSEDEFGPAVREASSEAQRAFRSGEVYIEKVIENPRHIEVQIIGDQHGNLVHLGERECSLQRRHQKVLEECPSPLVAAHREMRSAMGEAAIKVARAAGYYNAGTVEFLVDQDRNFYFLEVNTRLQVEHPTTELVTGLDLVHLQLQIAAGEPLPFTQEDIAWEGVAIECRISAEDPEREFFPSPGTIRQLREPAGPGIRLDSGVYQGWTVPIDYDPLLAKLVVWERDRNAAIGRMLRALQEYSIAGIQTNLDFFRELLNDECFVQARLHTGFLDEFMKRRRASEAPEPELEWIAAVVAASHEKMNKREPVNHTAERSRWLQEGHGRLLR